MFEHVTVFMSFIFALAIAHLLSSITDLVLARDRVIWSPLLLVWMAIALLLVTHNWITVFRLARVTEWTVGETLLTFATAAMLYFTCSLTAIRVREEGPVDMPAYFERQRPAIMTAFILFGVIAIWVNLASLPVLHESWGWSITRIMVILPGEVAIVAALLFRASWVQWTVGLFVLIQNIYFMFQFAQAH